MLNVLQERLSAARAFICAVIEWQACEQAHMAVLGLEDQRQAL